MKCIGLLIEDHKTILSALEVLQAMAERTQKGEALGGEDGFFRPGT